MKLKGNFKKENSELMDFSEVNQCLHGDVIIEKINNLPSDFNSMKDEPNNALAYGEVTGHSHMLFRLNEHGMEAGGGFSLKQSNDGTKFLLVDQPIEVRHQEHDPRIIPPGKYKIGIQKEYDVWNKRLREVAD